MAGNIIAHDTLLVAKNPQLVWFEVDAPGGGKRRAATATGYLAEHLQGRRYSANHSFEFDIAFGFEPGQHALSLAPRGFELRGVPIFGFRRVGWNIIDYEGKPQGDGLRVNVTVWVNHKNAWSLGLIYTCTALSQ